MPTAPECTTTRYPLCLYSSVALKLHQCLFLFTISLEFSCVKRNSCKFRNECGITFAVLTAFSLALSMPSQRVAALKNADFFAAFPGQVVALPQYRLQLSDYLRSRMQAIAPNLTIMVGELVGARLIAHAGSLINLAKQPASTVQILGAEKALFRALKTKVIPASACVCGFSRAFACLAFVGFPSFVFACLALRLLV